MMKEITARLITIIIIEFYVFSTISCNKYVLDTHTVYCNSNETLSVYSKQGTGLVILDLLYEESRDCMLSKTQQELNNNCQDSTRYCEWN